MFVSMIPEEFFERSCDEDETTRCNGLHRPVAAALTPACIAHEYFILGYGTQAYEVWSEKKMNLTPRIQLNLERVHRIASDQEMSNIRTKTTLQKLSANPAQERPPPSPCSKDSSLTTRFEKLIEKCEHIAHCAQDQNGTNELTRYSAEGYEDYYEDRSEIEQIISHEAELSKSIQHAVHIWEKRFDQEYHGTPESPVEYYFDKISGVSQWEKPPDFQGTYEPFEETLRFAFGSLDVNKNGLLEKNEVNIAVMLNSDLGQYIQPKSFRKHIMKMLEGNVDGVEFEVFKQIVDQSRKKDTTTH